ncbi:MAG: radical SAM protein [Deltaproteobacteria bacterium]|jgi:DNA repair photolyase|nr:radical SAM protein [Deltaproteobacteria bacterium]
MAGARVVPREARQILTRTGGYLTRFTHTLQPYVGCQFSCVYCYVREMAVQKTNPYGLPFSAWISPKRNAVELLARAAKRPSFAHTRIFCSSSTDPYTPLERTERLTRGCLEVMVEHPPEALVLQTRSPLIERDAELIARLPRAAVSFTVTTDDEAVRRAFEPDSPRFARRIQVLAALRAKGLRVQAAISPLLPCDPERLAVALAPHVDRVVVDDLFAGDGAGGRRSGPALERLRALGYEAWAEPDLAERSLDRFRAVLGPDRVAHSQAGFNDLSWLT